MLDHISIRVSDYDRSKKFYEAALAPLGFKLAMESDSGAGFRKEFIPGFWIKQGEPIGAGAPTFTRRRWGAVDLPSISRSRARPAHGRRLLSRGLDRRRHRQRRAGIASQLSPELLRRVCSRSGWVQHRSGVPQGRVRAAHDSRKPRLLHLRGVGRSEHCANGRSAFAAKHRDRVHAGGPAGRHQCREEAHERHRDASRGERDRVERRRPRRGGSA